MARISGRAAQTRKNMAASSWLEFIATFGYAAVGVLYLLIGWLALKLAIKTESRASDAQRVLVRIGGQPYGKVLLGILAGGLLAFALWRVIQAISVSLRGGAGRKRNGHASGLHSQRTRYTEPLLSSETELILGTSADRGSSTRSTHTLLF